MKIFATDRPGGSFMRRSIALFFTLFVAFTAHAEDQRGFLPTWKLLAPEAKEQFIAGYLEGWRDAGVVTDIATQYVKENPQKALEGLEKIKVLYDMSSLKTSAVVSEINGFYRDPENSLASLSKAVSYAKERLSSE